LPFLEKVSKLLTLLTIIDDEADADLIVLEIFVDKGIVSVYDTLNT
jgi:hypothetical protein